MESSIINWHFNCGCDCNAVGVGIIVEFCGGQWLYSFVSGLIPGVGIYYIIEQIKIEWKNLYKQYCKVYICSIVKIFELYYIVNTLYDVV